MNRLDASVIAFVGLGQMGDPMARRVLGAGYQVRLFDLEAARVSQLNALNGAVACANVGDAALGADMLITMLPDDKAVRAALMQGERPAVANLNPGALVIDMSSSAPLATRQIGSLLHAHGVRMIDAPVSGGVKRAVDGKLTIMVGGERSDVDAARGLLGVMGEKIFYAGALGSGHAMKALNNYVSAAGLVAAIEALEVGQAFGLDPAVVTDILNASTGKNNSTELKLHQYVLSGLFNSGFGLSLMSKDLNNAAALARGLQRNAPLMQEVAAMWEAARAQLAAGADHTEIARFIQAQQKVS